MQKKKSPANPALYNRVKAEAKRKFRAWPSAYASGWLVKEYKRRGGTYKGSKTRSTGLTRWFDEEWIDVCKLPKKVPCGRPSADIKAWKKKYPYCRPSKRITRKSPKTAKSPSLPDQNFQRTSCQPFRVSFMVRWGSRQGQFWPRLRRGLHPISWSEPMDQEV